MATSGKDESVITTLDGKTAVHASLADIAECLPDSRFAKIHWNEVLNLSFVDRVDANILYVGRASFSVDMKYVESVRQSFMKVEKCKVADAGPSSYYDSIFLRVGECYQRVKIDEIMWIESYHNYCDVHVKGCARPYCSVFSLTAWQKVLSGGNFVRVHRSLIINTNYVDRLDARTLYIGTQAFDVPKAHRHIIHECFHIFQRKKDWSYLDE